VVDAVVFKTVKCAAILLYYMAPVKNAVVQWHGLLSQLGRFDL